MRRFRDPAKYRIVLMRPARRRAQRRTPGLVDNTTWDLVADIGMLRELLGIERWQVFGGSGVRRWRWRTRRRTRGA